MGTTAEKGAYIIETKSLLKDKINNLGGSIDDNTTFRNYANQLQNVYDNLPKTSFQTGTEVTLENCLKGKLDFDEDNGKKVVGIGQSSQDGEPTPTNEVPIQCVTGNQDVVVSGKNLLEPKLPTTTLNGITCTNNGNGSFTFTGTATDNTNFRIDQTSNSSNTNLKNYKAPYTISMTKFTGTSYGTLYIGGFNANNQWITPSCNIGNTATLTSDIFNAFVYIRFNKNEVVNETIYPMIEEGSTATTYEPYITPTSHQLSLGDIELCGIGNYKDELIYDVDEDKVYKNKAINKYTFTGNETGVIQNSGKRFDITCSANNIPICINNSTSSEISPIYCNILVAQSGAATWNGTQGISYNTGNNGQILVSINSKTTQTEYLNVLKDNYCYYVLKEAVKEEITDTTLVNQVKALYNAHSLNGTTIITSNGNLPMIIKVRALKGE